MAREDPDGDSAARHARERCIPLQPSRAGVQWESFGDPEADPAWERFRGLASSMQGIRACQQHAMRSHAGWTAHAKVEYSIELHRGLAELGACGGAVRRRSRRTARRQREVRYGGTLLPSADQRVPAYHAR